jgi:molecular chaperone DnaK (HSP70)
VTRTPALVGIDLGTTNTVLAYAARRAEQVATVRHPQLVAPGEVGTAPLLPSSRYHPPPANWRRARCNCRGNSRTPAGVERVVVGRLARSLGAAHAGPAGRQREELAVTSGRRPHRAHPALGRADDVPKVSPLAASASYLAHLRAAGTRASRAAAGTAADRPHVPASFDEGARALTLEAARLAGLPDCACWKSRRPRCTTGCSATAPPWRADLADAKLVLVADVGGGTTDFSWSRSN